jgi:carbon-monoxide dehydrogenase medium subunit
VKPAPFRYVAPDSLDEVIGALSAEEDSRVIAGGQSLVPLMAFRLAQPELLVDLRRVASLATSVPTGNGLTVGAMVSQSALADADGVHPLVRQAIPWIAHAQIRNRGTVCGSLAHADPAAELPAVAVALDAVLVVHGPAGERRIPARDFFVSYFTTVLEPGEVLTAVEFPNPQPGERWAIEEVARRRGDFALAGVVTRLVVQDGVIGDVAVVPFAVGDRPRSSAGAVAALVGRSPTDDALDDAAQAVAAEVDPASDGHASAAYRRHAVAVLTRRALQSAARRSSREERR